MMDIKYDYVKQNLANLSLVRTKHILRNLVSSLISEYLEYKIIPFTVFSPEYSLYRTLPACKIYLWYTSNIVLQAFKQISQDSSSPSVRGQRPLCACALEENGGFRACALRFSSAGCTTFTRRWAPHFYHSAVDSSSQTENLDFFGNFAMFVCDFNASSDLLS